MATKKEYDQFTAAELGEALSHYDLGLVQKVTPFRRGSRRAPKLIIKCERGKYLFKRRSKGKDDLARVAFTHQIQLSLAAQNFPLPHLLGTIRDNNSMLVLHSNIYEMFEYIKGSGYDGSLESTFNAGRILGLYHKLLANFQSEYTAPGGSYHNARAIHQSIRNTVGSLPMESRPPTEILSSTVEFLEKAYMHCSSQVGKIGLSDWPKQIVHGDWHPGNMLFSDKQIVAVIDYDAARLQQRVIDLANGSLQFSIIGGSDDPTKWPDYIDESRFKRFVLGYDKANVISRLELKALPYLMCEAMIAEAVLPIAATGSFGRIPGFPFLQMVERKVRWILDNIDHLRELLDN